MPKKMKVTTPSGWRMSAREIKLANTQARTADDGSTRGVWLTVPRPGRSSNSVCHRIRTVRMETGYALRYTPIHPRRESAAWEPQR